MTATKHANPAQRVLASLNLWSTVDSKSTSRRPMPHSPQGRRASAWALTPVPVEPPAAPRIEPPLSQR